MSEPVMGQMSVRLEARNGALLAIASIPRPEMLPEVVRWGERLFVSRGRRVDGNPLYREAISVIATSLPD